MFGLDERIAALGSGEAWLVVAGVAILLGLRHATDPDHLTAVSTLVAGERDRHAARARLLGLSWGLGHATTLLVLGLPLLLSGSYLPDQVQAGAEVAIGALIMALAIRLLARWRRGALRAPSPAGGRSRTDAGRSPLQAYGIGLVHGIGGSAGVGVLLLADIPSRLEGVVALALFASFTAVSMAIASTTLGHTLSRPGVLTRFTLIAPALGALSLAFGAWYALAALDAVPYFL
jgi:hypothetical protein